MFKRTVFFIYGAAAYLTFLATFLYAIAFVGGFAVPRRLDGPLETSVPAALAIDCLLLTVFAVQHSVMARRWFKERWTQVVPWTIERSTYVLFASLALLLLFWQWRPIGIEIWTVESPAARVALWSLFAAGWGTVLVVTFLINHFDLFGLRQVWLPLIGRPYTPVSFRTPLPYRFVRHPLYFGFLLAFWMTPTMTLAHLVFAVATSAYIVLAIQFEERDLLHEHGAPYQAYRRAVPMLLPVPRATMRRRPGLKSGILLVPFAVVMLAEAAPASSRGPGVSIASAATIEESAAFEVRGRGQAPGFESSEALAFHFAARKYGNRLTGDCGVVDRAAGVEVTCLDVTSLVRRASHVTICGKATSNASPLLYQIDVDDEGEPGTGRDRFWITLSNGYAAGGLLASGEVRQR